MHYFTVPIPGERIARAQLARASSQQQPTSAGYRGEQCIDSYGDDLAEDLCYDHSTQLELCTEEYLWDGEHDFSYYANEEELEIDNSDIVWDDAKELEVETCYDAEEEVSYHDAEVEDCNYYCFAEDCYDY